MHIVYPSNQDDASQEHWWAPLVTASQLIAGKPRHRFFEVEDFMIMGRVVRRTRPDITLYKHRYTRGYLNLDETGRAYRYNPPRTDRGDGTYAAHRNLDDGLEVVGLSELPWMKPGLEEHQHGRSWDERWELDSLDGCCAEAALLGERRLRLV
jgi:hypothetical protein